jgi:hypothetical protein
VVPMVLVCLTKTKTMSRSDNPVVSVTVNLKTSRVSFDRFEGAEKLVFASLGLLSCTGGPLICVHTNDNGSPSGS